MGTTLSTTITDRQGGVTTAVVIPSPYDLQSLDVPNWGIYAPPPRFPTNEPDPNPRKRPLTVDEMEVEHRRGEMDEVCAIEQRRANIAYDHLPSKLSHLTSHQPGLMVWQCRACLKMCASFSQLARHTGVTGIAKCHFFRNVLAEIKEQQKKEYEEESEEDFDGGDEGENTDEDKDEDEDEDDN